MISIVMNRLVERIKCWTAFVEIVFAWVYSSLSIGQTNSDTTVSLGSIEENGVLVLTQILNVAGFVTKHAAGIFKWYLIWNMTKHVSMFGIGHHVTWFAAFNYSNMFYNMLHNIKWIAYKCQSFRIHYEMATCSKRCIIKDN